MNLRTLFALSACCLALVVHGTVATQGWSVAAGLVGMVATSFMFAIKTDDPDRTIHEIVHEELEPSNGQDQETAAAFGDAAA